MALGLFTGLTADTAPTARLADVSSVNFDGTNDFMSTGGDDVKKDRTYTFWAKSTNTAATARSTVFSHGSTAHGAFHFNWGSSLPLLYLGSSYWTKWNDNSAQDDSAWHFFCVVVDVDSPTTCLLYIDGALQTANSYSSSGSANGWNALDIGKSTTEFMQGNLDEFCVFDGHLSAASVVALYNGGEPSDPNRVAQPGQLEHWWRMGDDGGSGPFIPDHANLGLGAELVTNGGFDTDSGWTIDGGDSWVISGGTAHTFTGSDGNAVYRALSATVGEVYEVSLEIKSISTGTVYHFWGGGTSVMNSTVGVHKFHVVNDGNTALGIRGYSSTDAVIDNISVKLVNGKPGYLYNGAVIQTDAP